MGNKLYVDGKNSEIDDILNFNINEISKSTNNMNISDLENNNNSTIEKNFKNLKVWRFFESEDEKILSESVKLTKLKEDRFLLSSAETYIILIIFKIKDDYEDMTIFPNSLWGVVESSSNMTPRGLKYAFSTCNNSESLESFLLSKRDFKNSDYKYLLFIWNGKNCAPLLKSHVLMKAFELDKKLSNPSILPYLYNGFNIENQKIIKNAVVNLNQIINNTFENLTEEPGTPSTESFINYHETVYLLQLLYPKKLNKRNKISLSNNKKNILFGKFNKEILNSKNSRNFYDNFINLKDYNLCVPNSKRSQFSRENNNNYVNNLENNIDTFSLRKYNDSNQEKENENSKSVENNSENEDIESSEYEDDDLNDDLYFEDVVTNRGMMSKLNHQVNLFSKNNIDKTNSIGNTMNMNRINTNNFPVKERREDFTLSSSRNNNSSSRNYNNNGVISSSNRDDDHVSNEDSFNNLFSHTSLPITHINKKGTMNENFSINCAKSVSNANLNIDDSTSKSGIDSPNKNNKINDTINANKLNSQNSLKINLINTNNKSENKNTNFNQISKLKEIKIPKLIMGIQHKILNDDLISQRMNQQSEVEEKLDNLPESVIKKSSDKIFTLKKLDIKNILENMNKDNKINYDNNKESNDNLNNKNSENTINNLKQNFEKIDISRINEDFNIRDSDRKHIVMEYFSKNISEVLEGFLYLSNYAVARNKDLVFENKITHIINCAADICQNHFLDDGIVYTNYYLKDHPLEVI